jgi:hypothetical protein
MHHLIHEKEDTCMSYERRRIHACHMRRKIHACFRCTTSTSTVRRRIHACHVRGEGNMHVL